MPRYTLSSSAADLDTALAAIVAYPSEQENLIAYHPKHSIPMVAGASVNSGIYNGAAWVDSGDQLQGVTVPVGQTGYQTYIVGKAAIGDGLAQHLAGRTVRLCLELETSAAGLAQRNWQAITQVDRIPGTVATLGTFTNKMLTQFSSTRALAQVDFTFTGVESYISIGVQQSSNSTGENTEHTITPVSVFYALIDGYGFADMVRDTADGEVRYSRTIVVRPDGTGDYTTLEAAIDAEGGGVNALNRIKYEVHEGVYTGTEYYLPNFADIVGIGRRENVWLKGYLPEDTATATIENTSTVWMNESTRLFNLTVTAQNMRYAIHSDSSASANEAVQEIHDCHIEHYDNAEAEAWQDANGGSSANVWKQTYPWGSGTHDGEKMVFRNTTFAANNSQGVVGIHTNKDFVTGNYVELDRCRVINQSGERALYFNENGSKVPHYFVLKDTQVQGALLVSSGSWLSTSALVDQGDRTGMMNVSISGCSPIAWTSENSANVLELQSTAGAGSAVVVSGTGAEALFGDFPVYRAGGSNYAGRVYSGHIINGVTGTGLGARLGDCTSTNKTLTIAFDGGASFDLTLDQDYSADSNATVISALNTLLSGAGGGGTFAEVTAYTNEAPVIQLDREIFVESTEATAVILKGMAVAYDGGLSSGKIATSSDARTAIAGIALENIAPGARGRVQTSGYIAEAQVLFSGTPAIAFGDTFGVHTTAGYIIEGASVDLLRAVQIGTVNALEII